MTNLTTIITVAVITNWASIGTFTDQQNRQFDVQEGRLQTNIVAEIVWKESVSKDASEVHFSQFVLKSNIGPVIMERKVEKPITYVTNWWYPRYTLTNSNVLTPFQDAK